MNETVGYFNNLDEVTIASFQNLWFRFLQYMPQIIGAIIILIVGWIVASLLATVVKKIIEMTGVDKIVNKSNLNQRLSLSGKYVLLSGMVAMIVKWFIIIATLMTVADVLNLPQITDFLRDIMLYIPRAIVAVIIITVGMLAAEFVAGFLSRTLDVSAMPVQNKKTLASVAKYAIIVFSILAALTQLGIVPRLIEILFAGVVLAFALAFGLGGREEAGRFLQNFRQQQSKP